MERKIYRGEIYYANLGKTVGSEQNGTRPVIVVQNNIGNNYSPTIIVVPLTKKIERRRNLPTHHLIKPFGKIKYNSIVLVEQIRVIDKSRLKNRIGFINNNTMHEIDKKLKIALKI